MTFTTFQLSAGMVPTLHTSHQPLFVQQIQGTFHISDIMKSSRNTQAASHTLSLVSSLTFYCEIQITKQVILITCWEYYLWNFQLLRLATFITLESNSRKISQVRRKYLIFFSLALGECREWNVISFIRNTCLCCCLNSPCGSDCSPVFGVHQVYRRCGLPSVS